MLLEVSKEMYLLFKRNSETGKRPDMGCQVSTAKSMLQCLRMAGAKEATLTEMGENSVFPPSSADAMLMKGA